MRHCLHLEISCRWWFPSFRFSLMSLPVPVPSFDLPFCPPFLFCVNDYLFCFYSFFCFLFFLRTYRQNIHREILTGCVSFWLAQGFRLVVRALPSFVSLLCQISRQFFPASSVSTDYFLILSVYVDYSSLAAPFPDAIYVVQYIMTINIARTQEETRLSCRLFSSQVGKGDSFHGLTKPERSLTLLAEETFVGVVRSWVQLWKAFLMESWRKKKHCTKNIIHRVIILRVEPASAAQRL